MEISVDKLCVIGLTVDIRRFVEIFHKHSQPNNSTDVENAINLFTAIN